MSSKISKINSNSKNQYLNITLHEFPLMKPFNIITYSSALLICLSYCQAENINMHGCDRNMKIISYSGKEAAVYLIEQAVGSFIIVSLGRDF